MATKPEARPLKESDIVEDLALLINMNSYHEERDHPRPLLEEKVCLYWLRPGPSDRSLGSVWWKRKRKKTTSAHYLSLSDSNYREWSKIPAAHLIRYATKHPITNP